MSLTPTPDEEITEEWPDLPVDEIEVYLAEDTGTLEAPTAPGRPWGRIVAALFVVSFLAGVIGGYVAAG